LTHRSRSHSRGFTLIELLVVIAIIALLAAILFPVFNTVKEATRRAQCRSNMEAIHTAMKRYHADTGAYPEALFGLSRNGGPLELTLGSTDYVTDKATFTCPSSLPAARNNMTLVIPTDKMNGSPAVDRQGRTLSFPMLDSYDFGYVPNTSAGTPELHYNRAWTGANQGLSADRRQLIQKTPPGDTVVTYCLNHAAMDSAGVPKAGSKALVLLLNGRVVELDAQKLVGWPGPDGKHPWQVQP
ncbi:MAG: type II secretion system protein, partial [Actinomycetota bacterium]